MRILIVPVCFLLSNCAVWTDNYAGSQCAQNEYVDGALLFGAASVPMSIVAGASIGTGIGAVTAGTYYVLHKTTCPNRD